MKRKLKNRLWMSVGAIAIFAGVAAAAVMAAQPATPHPHARHDRNGDRHGDGLLAAAASYLGAPAAQLKGELQSGKSLAEIANATSGKSAHGLIEALDDVAKQRLAKLTASLSARIAAKVNRPGWDVGHGESAMQAVGGYLGLNSTQLRSELRSGKTLAEIANATSGKSEAGLIAAVMDVVKARLATEVKAGSITQARANKQLPKLARRIASRVNRAVPRHRATTHEHPAATG